MDIISFSQAGKANNKAKELEVKLGHLDANKSGALPVQDSFSTVKARLDHLDQIQTPSVVLTEASHLAEEKMLLLNEETLRVESIFKSKSYGMKKMAFVSLRDLASIDTATSQDISYEEEYSRAYFESDNSVLYLKPIIEAEPINHIYVAVATKTEGEVTELLSDTYTYENLTVSELEGEPIVQPIELDQRSVITSELIKIQNIALTRFDPPLPKITPSESTDTAIYTIEYAAKIGEEEVLGEEGEESTFEPIYGEWKSTIDLYKKAFRFRIIIEPIKFIVPAEPDGEPEQVVYRSYFMYAIKGISYKSFSINNELAEIYIGQKRLSLDGGTPLEGNDMNQRVIHIKLPKGSELNAISVSWG